MFRRISYDNPSVKKIDIQDYMNMIRPLLEEGREVSMTVTGSSMSPFLTHGRDAVYMRKLDRNPKKGDIVFYQRKNGQYVMHRIIKCNKNGTYSLIGDGQTEVESGIEKGQIFARITKVRMRGTWIEVGDFWWEFFEHIWLRIVPFRRILIELYAKIHNRKRGS